MPTPNVSLHREPSMPTWWSLDTLADHQGPQPHQPCITRPFSSVPSMPASNPPAGTQRVHRASHTSRHSPRSTLHVAPSAALARCLRWRRRLAFLFHQLLKVGREPILQRTDWRDEGMIERPSIRGGSDPYVMGLVHRRGEPHSGHRARSGDGALHERAASPRVACVALGRGEPKVAKKKGHRCVAAARGVGVVWACVAVAGSSGGGVTRPAWRPSPDCAQQDWM